MCEYPHNPPVVCLMGSVLKAQEVAIKDLTCKYLIKVEKVIRPKHTYRYNKKLYLVSFKNNEILKKYKDVTMYSRSKNCKKIKTKIFKMARFNCSDFYKEIPDFDFIDYGYLKGLVHDPWTEKDQNFNCKKL